MEEYFCTIPKPGVKTILNNATQPIEERAEVDANHLQAGLGNALDARPAKLSTVHVTDWKKAQIEDPILYQVVKNLKAPKEQFREALDPLLPKKSVKAYLQRRDSLVLKDRLLYLKTKEGRGDEVLFRFVVPKAHRGKALDRCH